MLLGDSQFLPIFQPSNFTSDYLDNIAQFDLGVSYLFERGKKRQHRLQAAKDQTAVTRSQVADNERTLTFNVATDFINVELAESTLELANQDLKSFQDTVDITEARYKAGDIGKDDLLKMKLQLLQFQTDVAQAKLARVQGLSDLRQLLGYEQVSAEYDVAGSFDYQPMKSGLEDLQATALKTRPDLQAAQQGVAAANSQFQSAEGDRKAGCDRADQLHAHRLSERRFALRVDAAADLRPQPGRDQARRDSRLRRRRSSKCTRTGRC